MSEKFKQVIVVRADLKMSRSMMGSVIAKVARKFLLDNNDADRNDRFEVMLTENEVEWLKQGCTTIVLGVHSELELIDLEFKARFSEIESYRMMVNVDNQTQTIGCIAFGPDEVEKIDAITGHLRLI